MNETVENSVSFEREGGVGYITFNRPPANAYELGFHQAFNAAIEAADEDGATRVVIVRSAIEKFFCAGADIKVFAENSVAENKEMVTAAQNALAKIEASKKIFIACIEGHALGGGLEIAMACDMRFGSRGKYKLGLPEVRLGLLPGNGGSQRLPRIVGASQALVLLTSGGNIDPEEACRIGLLNRLFDAKNMRSEVQRFAEATADGAPLAIAACKQAVYEGMSMNLKDALALESSLLEELYETEDAKEGFIAFTEKRPPIYKGK